MNSNNNKQVREEGDSGKKENSERKISWSMGVVMHTYSPSTWEVEAGIQGQPLLHSEFQAKVVHETMSKKGGGRREEEWHSGTKQAVIVVL